MGVRFRGRVRIFKGFSLNFGKSGLTSASVGRRGFTVNVGRKGTRTTVGLPGTGISYQGELHPYERNHSAALRPQELPVPDTADSSQPGPMLPAPPSTTIPWWAVFLAIAIVTAIVSLLK